MDTVRLRIEIPETNSSVLSVRPEFCERFKCVSDFKPLTLSTPASVTEPPQSSRVRRLLKTGKRRRHKNVRLCYEHTLDIATKENNGT